MKIGKMNNPNRAVVPEIERIGREGFEFVDLTIEGPHALEFDVQSVREMLDHYELGVVGHTDPHLPYTYPIGSIRKACLQELERCAAIFAELGAEIMNIHPSYQCPPGMKQDRVKLNEEALVPIAHMAHQHGLQLALENLLTPFGSTATFEQLLANVPHLAFHLDAGHANLGEDDSVAFCRALGDKLVHVHLSDNRGMRDAHMPLGAGRIRWHDVIQAIKATGFDGAITLEVFCNDDPDYDTWTAQYLDVSRSLVAQLWETEQN